VWCTEEFLSCCGEVAHTQLVLALTTLEAIPMNHLALDLESLQLIHHLGTHVASFLGASKTTTHGAGGGGDVNVGLLWTGLRGWNT